MNCDNCFEILEVKVLSGSNEPLEKLYTCHRCGREVLSCEGIRDEIIEEGRSGN